MSHIYLTLFDLLVDILVYIPFVFVCAAAVHSVKMLLKGHTTRKNVIITIISTLYILTFICFKIFMPHALAPIFTMISCLIPVAKETKKLLQN